MAVIVCFSFSINPNRVRAFQGRYYEKRLVFAIHPDSLSPPPPVEGDKQKEDQQDEDESPAQVAGALSPAVLMEALSQLTDQMLEKNEVFAEITGYTHLLLDPNP